MCSYMSQLDNEAKKYYYSKIDGEKLPDPYSIKEARLCGEVA